MITRRKMNNHANKKVLVGMSGGVDSSVAVALLKDQSYEVIGATMLVLKEECRNNKVEQEAKEVAKQLDVSHISLHLEEEFDKKIIASFITTYMQGRTPNPCILCNRIVKFEELLKKATTLNIPYIATGHYANVEEKEGRYLLKKSKSRTKDQTYVLYNLTQEQLAHTIFPLGNYNKEEIRALAKAYGLAVAKKPDSQEICFVEDNDYGKFIAEHIDSDVLPGNFVDTKGNILGQHKGIYYYTVGQRKGLGIASNKPLYVVDVDIEKNEVVIGDDSETFSNRLVAKDLNWIAIDELKNEMKVDAKIRYGAKETPATIKPIKDDMVEVIFDNPQRAITPGQSVVFYDNDIVIGGGIIQ